MERIGYVKVCVIIILRTLRFIESAYCIIKRQFRQENFIETKRFEIALRVRHFLNVYYKISFFLIRHKADARGLLEFI